jgi:hypothetical protein
MPHLDPSPYPVPRAYFRDLCLCLADPAIPNSQGQREAARLLKAGERTVRHWCSDEDPRECPWAAAELLRRLIIERHGTDANLPNPKHYPPDEKRDPPPVG